MAVVTETWLTDILLLCCSLLFLLYWLLNRNANYFKDRGIPYLPSSPVLGLVNGFKKPQIEQALDLYNKFPNERFFGYFQFTVPTLLVKDPDLVQRIMVKDFANFYDRGLPIVESDTLSQNLFNMSGNAWRTLRQKLIPTFTTAKFKQMFEQLDKCGDSLLQDIDEVAGKAIEVNTFMFNFPSEVIASTAFGIDLSRNNPKTVEFITKINNIFAFTFRKLCVFFGLITVPKLMNYFRISSFAKDDVNYFSNLVKANKNYRIQNNIKRNDYFQLLLGLQEMEESGKNIVPGAITDNYEEDSFINQMEYVPQELHAEIKSKMFTDEGITAQSFVFLTGGAESATSTICFTLYQIAKNLEIQRKLIEEVDSVLTKHGSWTYQAVKDLTYLDQVLQESMRLHTVFFFIMRVCTTPYAIPDSKFVIEKGTLITIPVAGLHMDPTYYPSPEVFDPDRFADSNFKPSPTFMPFGDGPRICIAMKFAIFEIKVCLGKILSQFSVEVNTKTKEPFTYDEKAFFPKVKDGIWMNFKKRPKKTS